MNRAGRPPPGRRIPRLPEVDHGADGWFDTCAADLPGVLAASRLPRSLRYSSAQDVLDAKAQGKIGILLGRRGKVIEDRLENLHVLYDLVCVTSAHWPSQPASRGELDTEGKAHREGRQVIREMNRLEW